MAELDKTRFNHSPFISNVTVPFNGWRFKTEYVITDKTGLVVRGIPNGGAWCCENGVWVEDEDVVSIQTVSDTDVGRFSFTGGWRVARDIDFFGKDYPIYCDGEYIYPDQLPDGKKIIPVLVFGYRSKRSDNSIYLITATGEIVDKADPRSGIDELVKYTQDLDYFWQLPNTEVMSPAEVINSINEYKTFIELRKDEVYYKEVCALLTDMNVCKEMWVSSVLLLPTLEKVKECQLIINEEKANGEFDQWKDFFQPPKLSDSISSALNATRGPIPHDKLDLKIPPAHTVI